MKKLIYIAAPYTLNDPAENTYRAVQMANKLMGCDCIPFVPHLTHLWHLITPRPYEDWMEICETILVRCDAVLRLSGESKGADKETKLAIEYNIPVFNSFEKLTVWLDREGYRKQNVRTLVEAIDYGDEEAVTDS